MGQSSSSASLPSADPRVPYFALTFQTPDKLTLILADESIVDLTRRAIQDSLSTEEDPHHDTFLHFEGKTDVNAYEFKFRDFPFMRGCGDQVYLRSQRLCCGLLESYADHGYRLELASDMSRGKETTTWFFHKRPNSGGTGAASSSSTQSNGHPSEKRNVACVCMTRGDTIQLVNGPAHVRRLLAQAVREGYASNAIKHESITYDEEYVVQLIDQPWASEDPVSSLCVRRMMLQIVKLFETEGGYRFYGTVNTKGAWDTMFFMEVADEQRDTAVVVDHRAYFGISLNMGTCVTLIDAQKDVVDAVLRAIVRYWPTKLLSQTMLDEKGAHEFRLKGNPWYATGGDEATAARVFICGLLETLHMEEYETLAAMDVSRGFSDKAFFICRSKGPPSAPRSPHEKAAFILKSPTQPFWCISLQDESKIRLINAPENVRLAVRHAIEQIWPWKIQRENTFYNGEGYVFKLGAGPWGSEHHQNLAALMTFVLKVVNDQGCRAVVSADVTGRYIANNHGGSHSLDVHSWFLTCESGGAFQRQGSGKKQGRRYSRIAEMEEMDEDVGPLRTFGEARKERPRRKISAVEYTSYVVNAEPQRAAATEEQQQGEEADLLGPLRRQQGSVKRTDRSIRKASSIDY